ncbi:hypothetical protein WJX73_000075 [Symbiochloris irregularis]|uniref:Nudix hydrolase domain-containing protein n=1 Tax=Symbiochloris irregularis TaxID=706552 RepID=A0AAW1NJC5_9CHLO
MDNGAAGDLLTFAPDAYGGVVVDGSQLPKDPHQFEKRLQATLQHWRQQSVKGVWLQLHIRRSNLINIAISQGFTFHHAEPTYVMLTHWLADTESTLPANPSHQVGIGAFCMNEHREVLVVQEAHGPLRGKGVWKMPTGLVNAGEDLHEAAVREVLEETGVRSKFEAVLCARQSHGVGMGRDKSDLFFVCALRPEPGQRDLVPQESELAAAAWLPLQEFGALEFLRQRPLHAIILDKCLAYAQGTYKGLQGFKLDGGLRQEPQLLLAGPDDGKFESAKLEEASRL